jgi:hypothetical protein
MHPPCFKPLRPASQSELGMTAGESIEIHGPRKTHSDPSNTLLRDISDERFTIRVVVGDRSLSSLEDAFVIAVGRDRLGVPFSSVWFVSKAAVSPEDAHQRLRECGRHYAAEQMVVVRATIDDSATGFRPTQ